MSIDHGTTLCHLWWRQSVCLCVQAHSCKYCNLRAIHYRNIKLTPQVPTENKAFDVDFGAPCCVDLHIKRKSHHHETTTVPSVCYLNASYADTEKKIIQLHLLEGYKTNVTCLFNAWLNIMLKNLFRLIRLRSIFPTENISPQNAGYIYKEM